MFLLRIISVLFVLLALAACGMARGAEGLQQRSALRRPVALTLEESGRWLFVANRTAGTISVVDCQRQQVVDETQVGERLADLAMLSGDAGLLAVDEVSHEVAWLTRQEAKLQVAARLNVPPYPVSIAVAADGSRAFVASLWSRMLSVVRLRQPTALEVEVKIPLELAPRKLLLVDEDRILVVADSFGGKLALIETASAQVKRVAEIPAHNIRGLALDRSRGRLLVSHQILDGLAETTRPNVHWGALMTDVMRSIDLASLLGGDKDLPDNHVHPFDDQGGAGGDPAGLTVTSDGVVVQTLAGVGKLAIAKEWESDRARLAIGRRPTAVTLDAAGRLAYVADTFGDAIVVVDVRQPHLLETISLGPQPELSQADRGELSFYDARLTLDGWYSCHSCHTDGHTNGLLTDNLGDGGYGAPKRVLSLLGTGDTAPWAWNGGSPSLETQIRKSIESTMQGRRPEDEQVAALAAYLHSLKPPPALDPLQGRCDRVAIERGRRLFEWRGCSNCHVPPSYTSPENFDTGLTDERGAATFNPPSLRGVSQRGPYFHDNRAASLKAVFREHQHPGGSRYSDQELHDLLLFLQSI